jgi:hypothetical protein
LMTRACCVAWATCLTSLSLRFCTSGRKVAVTEQPWVWCQHGAGNTQWTLWFFYLSWPLFPHLDLPGFNETLALSQGQFLPSEPSQQCLQTFLVVSIWILLFSFLVLGMEPRTVQARQALTTEPQRFRQGHCQVPHNAQVASPLPLSSSKRWLHWDERHFSSRQGKGQGKQQASHRKNKPLTKITKCSHAMWAPRPGRADQTFLECLVP